MLRRLLGFCLTVLCLLLAAGFLGAYHPAGDSLTVFRLPLAAAAAVVAGLVWLAGARKVAALGLLVSLAAAATTVPYIIRDAVGSHDLTLYQKNVSFRPEDPARMAEDILAAGADIVTLQEINRETRVIPEALAEAYPTQVICRFSTVGGPAVLSSWPERPGSGQCFPDEGMAVVGLDTPAGPVTAVSLHLHWPWPYGQSDQLERLLPRLERLERPVVIAGDFNMVAWSSALARIGAATGTDLVGRARTSFDLGYLGLAIDHVLAPGGVGTRAVRGLLGSDHKGIMAEILLP